MGMMLVKLISTIAKCKIAQEQILSGENLSYLNSLLGLT